MGPAGAQGQRGDKGDRGDEGPRGKDGKTGPQGAKGEDGADGVGIARIDSEIDNAFTVVLTDGTTYEIEMPLVTSGNPTFSSILVPGSSSQITWRVSPRASSSMEVRVTRW